MIGNIKNKLQITNSNITLASFKIDNLEVFFETNQEGMIGRKLEFHIFIFVNMECIYSENLKNLINNIQEIDPTYQLEYFYNVFYEESDRDSLEKLFLYILTEFSYLMLESNYRNDMYNELTIEDKGFLLDILTNEDNPYVKNVSERLYS